MSTPKRQKTTGPSEYLQKHVLTREFQAELANQISNSAPYEHGVIRGLLNDDVLRHARTEIFENIHFTEKETDIYKLNQTGDLLNLDGLPENEIKLLGSLLKVRDALYSQEFRELVSKVTKSGPLSGSKFDLSLNNYNKGCHLLAHDDVIGTRVISFILYLVPPDYEWNPKWGGALHLYPTLREGVPAADPAVSLPPQWNQLSFFKIIPGRSFHDVEEVYVDQPRLSIQGWFHAPQPGEPEYVEHEKSAVPPTSREKSTLSQLSHAHYDNDGYEPKRSFSDVTVDSIEEPLNDDERKFLLKYISSDVLDRLESLNEDFVENSSLTLKNFLNEAFWDKVKGEVESSELAKLPTRADEVEGPWIVASPPHLRRYLYLDEASKTATTGVSSLMELKSFFKTAQFLKLLYHITGVRPRSQYTELRRFRPGLDYTLASVSGVQSNLLEALLSITTAKWEDGMGGYDLVMGGGDDENDDPAVYRQATQDENGVLLSTLPIQNELVLILRDPDLLRFVKYVSKNANGSRWDVLGEYGVDDEDDEEKDADNESV